MAGFFGRRCRGFGFAVFVFVIVVDEFEFCADTTNPALAIAAVTRTATPSMKR
jgi:hypothetical protein